MTRIYFVEEFNQSVRNVCIKFDIPKEHWKISVIEENSDVLNGKKCWYKTMQIVKLRA